MNNLLFKAKVILLSFCCFLFLLSLMMLTELVSPRSKLLMTSYIQIPFNNLKDDHSTKDKQKTTPYFISTSTIDTMKSAGFTSLKDALERVASSKREVLMALVDEAFFAYGVSFYNTNIKRHGISNHLILTMHSDTCKHFTPIGANCLFYKEIKSSQSASRWGTQVFKNKMNVRTEMIIDALKLNYSVLHSDIDIYFFKNPFDHINCQSSTCDIAPLWDAASHNAGFLYIRACHPSLQVYLHMSKIAHSQPGVDDQAQLNRAISHQYKQPGGLKVIKLPVTMFQCGKTYFEDPRRYFADTMSPCPECVVAHNNWIVTMEAKRYRIKELNQWEYDGDQYYTSTTRKYLIYNNTKERPSKADQMNALKAGLIIAAILNRILIIPKFICGKAECPMNSYLKIKPFDETFTYREHSFLTHYLVPKSVKNSLSNVYIIGSKTTRDKMSDIKTNPDIHIITTNQTNVNEEEIKQHFSGIKDSVLQFHSLYDSTPRFKDNKIHGNWETRFRNGIKYGGYRNF